MLDSAPDQLGGHTSADGNRSSTYQPEWRTSMKGHKFDLNGDEWKLSSKMTIRPVTLRNILRPYPTLLEGAIRTLAWYAENKSGMTAEIIRHILARMFHKPSDPAEL